MTSTCHQTALGCSRTRSRHRGADYAADYVKKEGTAFAGVFLFLLSARLIVSRLALAQTGIMLEHTG